jgi:hypothetical protein
LNDEAQYQKAVSAAAAHRLLTIKVAASSGIAGGDVTIKVLRWGSAAHIIWRVVFRFIWLCGR